MSATWSDKERHAWQSVYVALQRIGKEHYFVNRNGMLRCRDEALAGNERATEVWAMYVAKRMTG